MEFRMSKWSICLQLTYLVMLFHGFNDDVKAGVNLLSPRTLTQTYAMAAKQEDALNAMVSTISKKYNNRPPFSRVAAPQLIPTSTHLTPKQPVLALPAPPSKWTSASSSMPTAVPQGPRRLSIAEQHERRAKNLGPVWFAIGKLVFKN
ncbi:hypothetical protein BVC80_1805g34 [Macleaya cordata]|uniref:Uncharacterized protein n=1 Tax=Macleaya cordata TaxID=56857 RepID=A0A200QQS9_MACCD|nr:hypothetical protein BVC80_1805g34 [Macleaya cordata]